MSRFLDWEFSPKIDWNSATGNLLGSALAYLEQRDALPDSIVLFGSSPLELTYPHHGFLSADVDLFSQADNLRETLSEGQFLLGQRDPYLDVCPTGTFRTCPDWLFRAECRSHPDFPKCTIHLPHPIDILVSKVKRMEPKDLEAFHRVREASDGHPTEVEMLHALRSAVDLFRPNFDEEAGGNAITGTRLLWNDFFRKDIDPRKEIISPAIAAQRQYFQPPIIESILRRF